LRRVESVEDVIVIIKLENGLIGYGSAAATTAITGDSQESIIGIISQTIAPKLIGRDINAFEEIINLVHKLCERNTSAKAAIDIALYDLFAKRCNIPLYQLLGGKSSEIITGMSIPLNNTGQMISDALLFISQGFKTLKIRAGVNINDDLERIVAICKAVGNDINLYIDANQGWHVKEAIHLLRTFDQLGLNISMIEQPVKANNLDGLKFIRNSSRYMVFADEACFSPHDALKIISQDIADGVSIKLMKAGGVYAANAIYSIANATNLPCLVGCMLESPISITAMASFAAGKQNIKFIDLDPIAMIKHNPINGGVRLDGAKLILSDKPGLGIDNIDGVDILYNIH